MSFIKDSRRLQRLDLYDNRLPCITGLENLENLCILDLSFNNISDLGPLQFLPSERLEELYLASNLIERLDVFQQNPSPFGTLRILELGNNSITSIEGLPPLPNLQELYLGKNRLATLHTRSMQVFPSLRILALSNNSLCSLEGLDLHFPNLEELYINNNNLTSIADFPASLSPTLTILDISNNKIQYVPRQFKIFSHLQELWANHNLLARYEELELLPKTISTIYLEGNPLAGSTQYRTKIRLIFPNIQQIDALLTRPQHHLPST
jgi:protein phosphatase 1 regulatory subunit 7